MLYYFHFNACNENLRTKLWLANVELKLDLVVKLVAVQGCVMMSYRNHFLVAV